MDREASLQKCSNVKCQRVQVNELVKPSLQDEVTEVEHLLAEPRIDHVSVNGILASDTTLSGKDDLELEVLDGFLDDIEIDDLEGTDGFSDVCGGNFLDFEFDNNGEMLGSDACEGSLLQSSNSESHSPGSSGSSIVGGISDSAKVPNTQSKCKNYSLDETFTYDSHDVFMNNPSQPSLVDCMYNISLDIQHVHEFTNVLPLAGSILSCKKENVSVEKCQPVPSKEKRLRKPTKRYIEELSNLRSKEKVPTIGTKNKRQGVSPCNELIRIKELKKIPGKSSFGNADVMHSELQGCVGYPEEEKLEDDNEPFSLESEEMCSRPKKSRRKDRRKHQRMWTASEVLKLVDGISEYGVGRWTDIKRFLFSSSNYRTPIDIRDKWRNLLKASSAKNFNKKEAEQNDKVSLGSLSSDVARRVQELARVHPYPRQRGSKNSRNGQVGSSVIASPSEGKGSPSTNLGRRVECTNMCN